MGQFEKYLEKLKRIPNDIDFDKLHTVLTGKRVNWSFRNNGGSHYVYFIEENGVPRDLVIIPRHGDVKAVYIDKVVRALEEQGIIDNEQL